MDAADERDAVRYSYRRQRPPAHLRIEAWLSLEANNFHCPGLRLVAAFLYPWAGLGASTGLERVDMGAGLGWLAA